MMCMEAAGAHGESTSAFTELCEPACLLKHVEQLASLSSAFWTYFF